MVDLYQSFFLRKLLPKKNDKLFDILNNYKKITFNSLISIPGYGYWLDKNDIKSHGFYIEIDPFKVSKQTKHGEVPFIDGSNWETHAVPFKDIQSFMKSLIKRKSGMIRNNTN